MTSREYKYHQRKKWIRGIHRCGCEGCGNNTSLKCVLGYSNEAGEWEEHSEWLCYEHAKGWYCLACGTFIAGTGMEYRNNGYCDNCWDQIKSDSFDDDEWDGDFDGDWDGGDDDDDGGGGITIDPELMEDFFDNYHPAGAVDSSPDLLKRG